MSRASAKLIREKQGKENRTKRDNTRRWNNRDMRIYEGQLQIEVALYFMDNKADQLMIQTSYFGYCTPPKQGDSSDHKVIDIGACRF